MYKIIESNISSDMNKPCWKLAKACPQSQKLFCFGENNLLVFTNHVFSILSLCLSPSFPAVMGISPNVPPIISVYLECVPA